MLSRRAEFWAGVRAQLPILLGTSPFGLIYGVIAYEAGLPFEVALGMSLIVFAGSSQFIAAQLFATHALGIVIVLTIAGKLFGVWGLILGLPVVNYVFGHAIRYRRPRVEGPGANLPEPAGGA